MRLDGLSDNGSGGGVRDDLSWRWRVVDGVINREYFNCVGDVSSRRNFLSRANLHAKNLWRELMYSGRYPFVVAMKLFLLVTVTKIKNSHASCLREFFCSIMQVAVAKSRE